MLTRSFAVCFALAWFQSATADELGILPFPRIGNSGVVPAIQQEPRAVIDKAARPNGAINSPAALPGSKEALIQKKLGEVDRLQREIQQLLADSGSHQQIVVRLQMMEVSLTKLRKLGMDFGNILDGNFDVTDAAGLKKAMAAMGPVHSSPSDEDVNSANSKAVIGFADWLERNNLAKVLARPKMAVISGRPASFFIGDEFPVPAGPDAKAAINFQKVGTRLDLTATVRDDKTARLEILVRVSERDETHSFMVNGSNIPALKVRQFSTGVDASFNEPVVFHGLLNKRQETIKTAGHVEDVENETVLLVVAIPELCEPLVGAQPSTRAKSRQ